MKLKHLMVFASVSVSAMAEDLSLYSQTSNTPVLKQKIESGDASIKQAMEKASHLYVDDFNFAANCYVATSGEAKSYYSEVIKGLMYSNKDFAKNLEGLIGLALSESNDNTAKDEMGEYCAGLIPSLNGVDEVVYDINQGLKFIYGLQLGLQKQQYMQTRNEETRNGMFSMAYQYADYKSPHALAFIAQDLLTTGDVGLAIKAAMESVDLEYKMGFVSMGMIELSKGNNVQALAWTIAGSDGEMYDNGGVNRAVEILKEEMTEDEIVQSEQLANSIRKKHPVKRSYS